MGIYDREYYRGDEPSGWQLGGSARSATIQIIAANVVVFVVCALGDPRIAGALQLHADNIYKPWMWWQFLSYGFVHSQASPMHLVANLFGLWFFGTEVEAIYGRRAFLRVYFAAILLGAIVWVSRLTWQTGGDAAALSNFVLLGASGGVMAIIILFCLKLPNRTILLMFVLPVPAWVLGVVYVVYNLFGVRSGRGNIAFDVHLTGALIGFLFFRYGHRLGWGGPPASPGPRRRSGGGSWLAWLKLKPKPKLRIHSPGAAEETDTEPEAVYEDLDRRGDEVLQKWHRDGAESLNSEERKILEAYSRRMKQKHR